MMKHAMIMASVLATSYACQPASEPQEDTFQAIHLNNLDTTASPAENFYRFVNGRWEDRTEVPADRGRWGSFDELRKQNDNNLLEVLETAIEEGNITAGSDQEKAVIFYETAMDTAAIDNAGSSLVKEKMQAIEKIESREQLVQHLIEVKPEGYGHFFSVSVGADLNDSDINTVYLDRGALGLPQRDYYLEDDADSKRIRPEYKKHIARMFAFLDYTEAEAEKMAENIFQLEKEMAEARMNKEMRRNTTLINNPRSVAEIQQMMPALPWEEYLEKIGAGKADTLIVTEPDYFRTLNKIWQNTDLETLKAYVKWTEYNDLAGYLSSDLEQANFDFYGKTLNGTPAMRPRSERALNHVSGSIGEALGKLYVDTYFPPEAKNEAMEMVENIKTAFGERIKQLPWMSDSTKEKALEKLATFKVKIGYPDEWKDYSKLEVSSYEDGGSYAENVLNVRRWNWEKDLADIGQPVDKSEWHMAPQTVNAYYSPLFNEIVFPAAILQPPFYHYKADPAVNYGGIGAVIGHEISHGFDDSGSRFDKEGNLKNWWTDSDREQFEERTTMLVNQYNAYEPLDSVYVNGKFTLGENIGDLGGINVAYDGLQMHLAEHGNPGEIDGFTQDQRFFISWATIWRTKFRDEALVKQIKTDTHSPGMYRAVGPIVNMQPFYDAFNVEQGDPMYVPKEERVYIW